MTHADTVAFSICAFFPVKNNILFWFLTVISTTRERYIMFKIDCANLLTIFFFFLISAILEYQLLFPRISKFLLIFFVHCNFVILKKILALEFNRISVSSNWIHCYTWYIVLYLKCIILFNFICDYVYHEITLMNQIKTLLSSFFMVKYQVSLIKLGNLIFCLFSDVFYITR